MSTKQGLYAMKIVNVLYLYDYMMATLPIGKSKEKNTTVQINSLGISTHTQTQIYIVTDLLKASLYDRLLGAF
jgi:hypothetical protein